MSGEGINYINRLKPYKNGNDFLWRLHRLDIQDKHVENIIVGAANRSVNLKFTMKLGGRVIKTPSLSIRPADRLFPITDGAVLFKYNKDKAGDQDFNENSYTFEIDFMGDKIINGRDILRTLEELVKYVGEVVDGAEQK